MLSALVSRELSQAFGTGPGQAPERQPPGPCPPLGSSTAGKAGFAQGLSAFFPGWQLTGTPTALCPSPRPKLKDLRTPPDGQLTPRPPRTLPPRPEPAFQNARLIPRSAGRSAVAPLKSSAPAEAPRLPLRKAHLDRAPPAQAAGPSAHCALRSTR